MSLPVRWLKTNSLGGKAFSSKRSQEEVYSYGNTPLRVKSFRDSSSKSGNWLRVIGVLGRYEANLSREAAMNLCTRECVVRFMHTGCFDIV